MHLLALSGSLRAAPTNTALLHALAATATPPVTVMVFDGLAQIPPYSPDRAGRATPPQVLAFARAVAAADGLVIACPENVRPARRVQERAGLAGVSPQTHRQTDRALARLAPRRGCSGRSAPRAGQGVSPLSPGVFARFALGKQSPAEVAQPWRIPNTAPPRTPS